MIYLARIVGVESVSKLQDIKVVPKVAQEVVIVHSQVRVQNVGRVFRFALEKEKFNSTKQSQGKGFIGFKFIALIPKLCFTIKTFLYL
jgi:hypothetical protein